MRLTSCLLLSLFPLLAALSGTPANAAVKLVSAADFHNADGSGITFTDFSSFIQKGGGSGHLIAPVELPDGAVVTSMSAWIGDSEPAGDFSLALLRKRRGNSVVAQLVSQVVSAGIPTASWTECG